MAKRTLEFNVKLSVRRDGRRDDPIAVEERGPLEGDGFEPSVPWPRRALLSGPLPAERFALPAPPAIASVGTQEPMVRNFQFRAASGEADAILPVKDRPR